jgi:hypothetical protein
LVVGFLAPVLARDGIELSVQRSDLQIKSLLGILLYQNT